MTQKPHQKMPFLSYSKEITLALLVKFLLLGSVWALFFAGTKQPVDESIIASKIFGNPNPVIVPQKNKDTLK